MRVLIYVAVMIAALLPATVVPAHAQQKLPAGFVYLRTLDPTIQQSIRYAGSENFTGGPVPGYLAAECVIVRQAAKALSRIQKELKPQGLGLKVFDCYRPAKAVAAFVRWAVAKDERADLKSRYYPNYARWDLFPGYIARRSGHSRGGTVDLTLIDLSRAGSPNEPLRDGCGPHVGGAELNMGTGFDCFDRRSRTGAKSIAENPRRNRRKLVDIMRKHGFRNYAGEWWHFTLIGEPYRRTYFDFEITKVTQPQLAD